MNSGEAVGGLPSPGQLMDYGTQYWAQCDTTYVHKGVEGDG